MVIINSNHHAPVGSRYFIGKIVAGNLFFDDLGSMHSGKRGLDDTQNDVSHQGDTKTKQRCPRIAQGIDLRIQMLGQMLEGGLAGKGLARCNMPVSSPSPSELLVRFSLKQLTR